MRGAAPKSVGGAAPLGAPFSAAEPRRISPAPSITKRSGRTTPNLGGGAPPTPTRPQQAQQPSPTQAQEQGQVQSTTQPDAVQQQPPSESVALGQPTDVTSRPGAGANASTSSLRDNGYRGMHEDLFDLVGGSSTMLAGGSVALSMGQDLAVPSNKVQISACGRTLELDAGAATSLQILQGELRRHLCMHGQEFEFMDVHGSRLVTDGDLQNALNSRRLPLVATLHEASIHYIENRREELSQMQWKLIRDQLSGLTDKVSLLGRRVQEIGESFANYRRDQESVTQRLRDEAAGLAEGVKEIGRQSVLQVGERVDAVSHMINSERNVREASRQGMERQVQVLRDVVEADRSTRRVEAASTTSQLEEFRQVLAEEDKKREALEDRIQQSLNRINDRIDIFSRAQADSVQDLSEQVKLVELRTNKDLQEHARQGVKVQASVETSDIEVRARCQKLEDKTSTLEVRLQDLVHRQQMQYEDLRASKDKLASVVQQVRLEERGRGLQMQSLMSRAAESEDRAPKMDDSVSDRGVGRSSCADDVSGRSTATSPTKLPGMDAAPQRSASDKRSPSPPAVGGSTMAFSGRSGEGAGGSATGRRLYSGPVGAMSSGGSIAVLPSGGSVATPVSSTAMARSTSPPVRIAQAPSTPVTLPMAAVASAPALPVARVRSMQAARNVSGSTIVSMPAGGACSPFRGRCVGASPVVTASLVAPVLSRSPGRDGRLSPVAPAPAFAMPFPG